MSSLLYHPTDTRFRSLSVSVLVFSTCFKNSSWKEKLRIYEERIWKRIVAYILNSGVFQGCHRMETWHCIKQTVSLLKLAFWKANANSRWSPSFHFLCIHSGTAHLSPFFFSQSLLSFALSAFLVLVSLVLMLQTLSLWTNLDGRISHTYTSDCTFHAIVKFT